MFSMNIVPHQNRVGITLFRVRPDLVIKVRTKVHTPRDIAVCMATYVGTWPLASRPNPLYCRPSLAGERDASAMLLKLYEETLGPYWDDKRKLVERRYKDIHIPPPFEELQRWDSTMTVETTVGGVMGMIASWSGYNSYREAHPNKPDPLMMFHGELKEELEFPGHDTVVDLEYPVFMLLARKPR
mmetsp:Transcript_2367/g.7146  ORF Transcript_2367/g.7146 Transcript_2367/m.7146 type:complete len:185 (+) Transcript_2367:882-1436(+)